MLGFESECAFMDIQAQQNLAVCQNKRARTKIVRALHVPTALAAFVFLATMG